MTYVNRESWPVQGVILRRGTRKDAPFLARMDYEASLPPFERSFWDDLVEPTGSEALAFLEEMFCQRASNWGNAEDFVLIEQRNEPIACCSIFRPRKALAAKGPLNLDKLPQIAERLRWSKQASSGFRAAYERVWDGDLNFLKPQAEVIIETVAVTPEARGKGLGHMLMNAAFDRAREMGASSIGIMAIEGNSSAKALYEKHFEPYATFHAAYFDHQFPGLIKYRATLARQRGNHE